MGTIRLKPTAILVVLVAATTFPSSDCHGQRTQQVSSASEVKLETADFRLVRDRVREEARLCGAKRVLVVVDIDNTLLAMDQDLGSDQWFNWQQGLLDDHPNSPYLVAKDFAGLLRAQGVLFSLSGMHPPEPSLPALVREIQTSGSPSLVLTSRGPEFRNAAERELKRNDYDFARSPPKIVNTPRGRFKPFAQDDPKLYDLTADEVETLRPPNWVTYSDGILMVAGQHKGYMLKTLLSRSPQVFSTIIFVDDHEKHTERMHEAFANTDVKVVTFRYSREDGNVDRFKNINKDRVNRQWKVLNKATRRALASRPE